MRYARYAAKVDTTQDEIVEGLRKCGYGVWVVGWPVDLLVHRPDIGFMCLEVKSPKNKKGEPKLDNRQAQQRAFIELTQTPYVTTLEQALAALGENNGNGRVVGHE